MKFLNFVFGLIVGSVCGVVSASLLTPKSGEEFDTEQICEMVDLFMAAGMKYFDTAFA